MPKTFDEEVETILAAPRLANWRIMAHYVGEYHMWWILAVGHNKDVAEAYGFMHAMYIESRGDRIGGVKTERWDWDQWREVRAK